MLNIEWRVWSVTQLIEVFPSLVDAVDSHLAIFPEEHQPKNRAAVESFKNQALGAQDIDTGYRSREISVIGFALDVLGRTVEASADFETQMKWFQAAHEIFRVGNRLGHPTRPMQQVMNNALRLFVARGMERIQLGDGDAGVLREDIERFVSSTWNTMPLQLALNINEMLLNELERVRIDRENDQAFTRDFIRNNIEAVLALDVPARMETILERWIEIGEHIAPAAVRSGKRLFRRPEKLSSLLSGETCSRLEEAVEKGDVEGLGRVLSDAEDVLDVNLRLHLNAKPEYRQPFNELRHRNGPDRDFIEARQSLTNRDSRALEQFKNIHFRLSNHTVAKEWYAYALTIYGRPTDIHEIIELLQDAIASEYFRMEYGWTARWNLSCALRRLPARSKESLDVLLPVLQNDLHMADAFELCMLWALEQDREDVLGDLLLKSPHYEAHLLAALYDTRTFSPQSEPERFHDHFRRISRIVRNLDYSFPDPIERLSANDLDELTHGFIENSLVGAGIEWFRQRLLSGQEQSFYKNWDCAARLNETVNDWDAALRCRKRQWFCTLRNRSQRPDQKARWLEVFLAWTEKHGYQDAGRRILRESWKETSFTDADVQLWESRLQQTASPKSRQPRPAVTPPESRSNGTSSENVLEEEPPATSAERGRSSSRAPLPPIASPAEAESIIQRTAGSFGGISNVDMLAARSYDAEQLISAVKTKHPGIPDEAILALGDIVRMVTIFGRGVDEEASKRLAAEMRGRIETLRECRQRCPFELHGLIETCERVSQNVSVRIKAVPDPSITPPGDLKLTFDPPGPGETYSTRVCARIANPSTEEMYNMTVAFTSPSRHINFLAREIPVPKLAPKEKCIVECPVELSAGIESSVEIRIFVSYESSGVKRSMQSGSRISAEAVGLPIPTTVRYTSSKPVGPERTDLFHGRDRELSDLCAAFSGGELRKLYFVNGIRRVGKSSLMQHLAARCGSDVLPLLLNIETVLSGQRLTAQDLVRQLMRECIRQTECMPDMASVSLSLPSAEKFQMDPPWVVFDDFLAEVRRLTQRRNVLLCYDEMQHLVERIADNQDPMDEGFLSWLRGKIQGSSGILLVCTGSEPYAIMRKRYEHTLWANMDSYNVTFVNRNATREIATVPVQPDGVVWLPESIDRLWDMTEGHPWVIQIIAEKVCERLNVDRRRVVMPSDVDCAVDLTALDDRVAGLWWNEAADLITPQHRQIAFLILQNQRESRHGLRETQLAELCQRAGMRNVGRLLEEMGALEVLSGTVEGSDMRWRVRGAFLERHLKVLEQRDRQERGGIPPISKDEPLALMLDWENVKIQLSKCLEELPAADERTLRSRLETVELAQRLFKAASRHGVPRQRWAVANWDSAFFQGDQAAFRKQVRYETDMAGATKADASDHVLRERIHEVLREHPEVTTFIIATGDADFAEVVRTLQNQGKRVVLWSTRSSINRAYRHLLSGPEAITVEWLEDIVRAPE